MSFCFKDASRKAALVVLGNRTRDRNQSEMLAALTMIGAYLTGRDNHGIPENFRSLFRVYNQRALSGFLSAATRGHH
jgi:hypothetical protein